MKKSVLALAAVCGLWASSLSAAVFTDWTAFDPFGNTASGTLSGVSVALAGGDIDVVFTDPTFPGFASGNFTPPTAGSEAVTLVISGPPGSGPTYTVTFGSAVTDPVIHIANLESTLTFTTASILKLSGSPGLTVAGANVSGFVGDEGTIQLSGSYTTFSFTAVPNFGFNLAFIQIGGTVQPQGGCTLVCPPAVVVNVDPNACSASGVVLGLPTVQGNCLNGAVANNAPAVFPKGVTVVTWTRTDVSGGVATCDQTVTVLDNQAPTIACPANVVANTGAGLCSAFVNQGLPVAGDNCPGVVVTFSRSDAQPLAAAYPKGVTVITWTATDAAGLTASCLQSVTVEDHEAPQFTCPPNVSVAVVPPPLTTATDNCDDNPTVTSVDTVSGGCSIVVTRVYTVTDDSGNVTTCTQLITVGGGLFNADAIMWHQPLARSGASEDTDPSAGGTLKYRFKYGSTIPIKVHALGCAGDVTANANVIGTVEVFGDSNCDTVADGNELPIDYNGVGGAGGLMVKVDGHLKYNLNTQLLPVTTRCYILRVTVTDTSTGQEKIETVLLQAK